MTSADDATECDSSSDDARRLSSCLDELRGVRPDDAERIMTKWFPTSPQLRAIARVLGYVLETPHGDSYDHDLSDHPQRTYVSPIAGVGNPDNGTERRGDDPTHVGPFEIRGRLGQGGMGVVYLAEQLQPIKRRVAIKVIRVEAPTNQVLARFEAERQALAMMEHNNIAKILDAGVTDDNLPYFAMELVEGTPIKKFCDERKFNTSERLDLFVQTCRAIHHAHEKGIVHRDIKPSNVLVSDNDGEPVVKVIDFGLAKALQEEIQLTARSLFTSYGQILGTAQYMSPEQAEMGALEVDARTDVYSLGVLLYELLTGSTPLSGEQIQQTAFDEILRLIREKEAPRPSTRLSGSGDQLAGLSEQRKTDPRKLCHLLRGDLDWITLKALEKNRDRRYDTAAALADDIVRHLRSEPISAHPPSVGYKLQKVARKHQAAFVSASIAIAITVPLMWLVLAMASTPSESSQVPLTIREPKNQDFVDLEATGIHGYPIEYLRGFDLIRQGRYPEAESVFRQFIDANSVYGPIGMGWSYLYRKDYQSAVDWFEKAERAGVQGDPSWIHFNGYFKALRGQNRPDAAAAKASKLLELNPTTANHFRYRVEVLVPMEDLEEARRSKEQAIKLDPAYKKTFDRAYPNL